MLLALRNMKKVGEVVDHPKALGDIRGVTYIYGIFYRFGLIDVPDEVKEKMGHPKNAKNRLLFQIDAINLPRHLFIICHPGRCNKVREFE